jgi:hypothetical protein
MAKVVVHEIVSNFDTIVVLKNPSIHFAPWDDSDVVAAKELLSVLPNVWSVGYQ